ncbi:MAG TPA: hypothetical protein VFU21_14240 [Kofleriaceae bacterium]|nr:hypothetical protein [Kofleriaceae bacterium]
MVRRLALAGAVAAALVDAGPARAEPPLLARAQGALDDLRYEEAAELAERAWRGGGNRREELVAIFQLAGQVAVTLGHGEQAEGYFIRLLTLEPDAQLPDGISPKIAARFAAARAKTPGRLRAAVHADGTRVWAEVTSDPVKMVSALRARHGKEAVQEAILPDPLEFEVAVERPTEVELALLDEHGNILVEDRVLIAPPRARAAPTRTQAQVGQSLAERNASAGAAGASRPEGFEIEDDEPRPSGPPVYTRWQVWAGAGGALGAVGIVFGLKARSAQSELDDLNEQSGGHDFRDAKAVEDQLRRDSLIANVSFVLAAGAGTAALLLWMRERRSRSGPVVTPTGNGAAVRFDF